MKNYLLIGISSVIISLALLACSGEGAIQINEPWIREAPPNVKVLAGYMFIKNLSSEQKILTSVASSAFESVELHKTIIRDGMMQMVAQPELIIAAKSQLVLEPGSYHLMLMGSKKPLAAGDEVDLTLKFADGEEIAIVALVRK